MKCTILHVIAVVCDLSREIVVVFSVVNSG